MTLSGVMNFNFSKNVILVLIPLLVDDPLWELVKETPKEL